jgi:hypothetical protein
MRRGPRILVENRAEEKQPACGGTVPTETRSRSRAPSAALDLPPPFRVVALREIGDAFAHAVAIAAEAGAGTIVHVGRFDLVEFAVVLEPEEPLGAARRAFYACMNALGGALFTHAPPGRPIAFDWPDAVRVDGGLIGGGRLAWPSRASEEEQPDWLVFGAMIRTVAMADRQGGLRPLAATLEEEGFDDVGSGRLVESFARHLMASIDTWRTDGFGAIAEAYLRRLSPEKGAAREIDEGGDLLVRWKGAAGPERRSLVRALAAPSWLDPATGGPRS